MYHFCFDQIPPRVGGRAKKHRGGGANDPPLGPPRVNPSWPYISVVYQPIWMKFLHNVMYDISFPKNIGLALYDLHDVSYDVIMTF